MERVTQTVQTLHALQLQERNSSVLPIVMPLFDALNHHDEYHPNTVNESVGYTQLLWQTWERRSGEFEQICLTLSKATLAVTIALDHRHSSRSHDIPVLPRFVQQTPTHYSMVIEAQTHSLYETNHTNGVLVATHYGQEAITRFTPNLIHSLAVLGLYGYSQNAQLEVS